MFKNFCLLFLLIFSSTIAFSQEEMLLNSKKSIPATEKWKFDAPTYSYSGYLNAQIGNNGTGGTLLVEIEASESKFYIGGTVYLFLEDGNVITCTDKNVRNTSEKMIQGFYILTPSEINLLKRNMITEVRLKVNGLQMQFSSPTGYFTGHNKIKSFGMPDKVHDTVTQIKQLFN